MSLPGPADHRLLLCDILLRKMPSRGQKSGQPGISKEDIENKREHYEPLA